MDVKASKATQEIYREAIFFLCHGCSVFKMVIIFIAERVSFFFQLFSNIEYLVVIFIKLDMELCQYRCLKWEGGFPMTRRGQSQVQASLVF